MENKQYNFIGFCKRAMNERGFTHIESADGTKTLIQDVVEKKIKYPHAPRGCFWASNGASYIPNITLYNSNGENLGFYKFVKESL